MPCLLLALLEAAPSDSPVAVGGGIAGSVAGLIYLATTLVKWLEHRRTQRAWKKIGPSEAMQENPREPTQPGWPPTQQHELTTRIQALEVALRERDWHAEESRQRLRARLREAEEELGAKSLALANERSLGERKDRRIAQLQRALDDAESRLRERDAVPTSERPTTPPKRRP